MRNKLRNNLASEQYMILAGNLNLKHKHGK